MGRTIPPAPQNASRPSDQLPHKGARVETTAGKSSRPRSYVWWTARSQPQCAPQNAIPSDQLRHKGDTDEITAGKSSRPRSYVWWTARSQSQCAPQTSSAIKAIQMKLQQARAAD